MSGTDDKGPVTSGGTNRRYRLTARYGAELLAVFVGVWLSLVAESWRQERIDAGTEQSSLERMRQDLELDLADLRINEARAAAGVDWGLRLIENPDALMSNQRYRNYLVELVSFRRVLLVTIRDEIDLTTTLLSSLDDRIDLLDRKSSVRSTDNIEIPQLKRS